MGQIQPRVAGIVIRFAPQPRAGAYLTALDRMDINLWRDQARRCGYDRMVVHEREPGDFSEMGNILCLYREGEAWSSWAFARIGGKVTAWCSVTGADLGEFPSLGAAFQAVMPAPMGMGDSPLGATGCGVVTDFVPRLRRASGTR
jgi:hypothetical protein